MAQISALFNDDHTSPWYSNTAFSKDKSVQLVSKQGKTFTVTQHTASMSLTLQDMLEDEDEETVIPLPIVDSSILEIIIEFMEQYSNDIHTEKEMPLIPKPLTNTLDVVLLQHPMVGWIQNLAERRSGPNNAPIQLFEVIKAANYMNIPPLLQLGCAQVASMIRGQTPEEIRSTLGIADAEFTAEETRQLKEENRWCLELR